MTEHEHAKALMEWAGYHEGQHPELKLLFHIPNGGARSKAVAGKLKAEGVKRGVPDYCLPVARLGFHGLFIELKTENGRATKEQKTWMNELTKQGYLTAICHGWHEAAGLLEEYLS